MTTNALESARADLENYIASAGDKPDAGIVRALSGAIARVAAAAAESLKPPAVNSGPERTTAQFLSDELRDEMARRNKTEADAYLAAAPFDADAAEQRRKEVYSRYQLGRVGGSTSIDGSL